MARLIADTMPTTNATHMHIAALRGQVRRVARPVSGTAIPTGEPPRCARARAGAGPGEQPVRMARGLGALALSADSMRSHGSAELRPPLSLRKPVSCGD